MVVVDSHYYDNFKIRSYRSRLKIQMFRIFSLLILFFGLFARPALSQSFDSVFSNLLLHADIHGDLVTQYKAHPELKPVLRTGYPEYPAKFKDASTCQNQEFHFTKHPAIQFPIMDGYIATHEMNVNGSKKLVSVSIRIEAASKRSIDSLFNALDEVLIEVAATRKTTRLPLTVESDYVMPEEKIKHVLIYMNKGTANMKLNSWALDIVIPLAE